MCVPLQTDHFMMKENSASVKDMEAAAIAWVCSLSNTPFFCVKVCSDIVDRDESDMKGEVEFHNYLPEVSVFRN